MRDAFPVRLSSWWNDNKSFAFLGVILLLDLLLHQFIIHFLFDLFENPVGISTASESQLNFFLLRRHGIFTAVRPHTTLRKMLVRKSIFWLWRMNLLLFNFCKFCWRLNSLKEEICMFISWNLQQDFARNHLLGIQALDLTGRRAFADSKYSFPFYNTLLSNKAYENLFCSFSTLFL